MVIAKQTGGACRPPVCYTRHLPLPLLGESTGAMRWHGLLMGAMLLLSSSVTTSLVNTTDVVHQPTSSAGMNRARPTLVSANAMGVVAFAGSWPCDQTLCKTQLYLLVDPASRWQAVTQTDMSLQQVALTPSSVWAVAGRVGCVRKCTSILYARPTRATKWNAVLRLPAADVVVRLATQGSSWWVLANRCRSIDCTQWRVALFEGTGMHWHVFTAPTQVGHNISLVTVHGHAWLAGQYDGKLNIVRQLVSGRWQSVRSPAECATESGAVGGGLPNGNVFLLCTGDRNNGMQQKVLVISADNGRTWTEISKSEDVPVTTARSSAMPDVGYVENILWYGRTVWLGLDGVGILGSHQVSVGALRGA